ncbi:hypothetical protein IE53DRAFT_125566 [Violaceomyces palustris]|uniref:Uncharacterized protein n=1 Tax=Violaceomyces palustris TaxID=1673888 RepID=A0ACD0P6H1_9BASI|nr:hypothetical protein IE53DRAFT_125566 [Violaceomyces palustris]
MTASSPTANLDQAKFRKSWSTSGSAERNSGPIAEAITPYLSQLASSRSSRAGARKPLVLEIASGFGQQISKIAERNPEVELQPTEADDYLAEKIDEQCSSLKNVRPAKLLEATSQGYWSAAIQDAAFAIDKASSDPSSKDVFDAILICNLTHVSPFDVTEAIFAQLDPRISHITMLGESRMLNQKDGFVAIYGAFKQKGSFTSEGDKKESSQFDEEIRARDPSFGLRDIDSEMIPLAERHGYTLDERKAMPANNLLLIFRPLMR